MTYIQTDQIMLFLFCKNKYHVEKILMKEIYPES